MRTHFINLFRYDHYANLRILDTIKKTNDQTIPVRLMAHMLAAQQVWLGRCKNEVATVYELWPEQQLDALEPILNEYHQQWINFLEYSSPDDLENIISYKNSRGDAFENKLTDILMQVINHGTHHRAQAGQHLKLAGIELPNTDYIAFMRQ